MAVVITVPICLLPAVAGLAVHDRVQDLGAARTTRTEVGLSLRIQALVHQLQRERGLTNGLLGGEKAFRPALDATRTRVGSSLRAMRGDTLVEGVVRRNLGRLAGIRAAADRGTADRAVTLTFYTDAIDALDAVDPVTETATRADRRLSDGLAALRELATAEEAASASWRPRGATSVWSATKWPSSPTAPVNCSPRSWYANSTPRPWPRDSCSRGTAPLGTVRSRPDQARGKRAQVLLPTAASAGAVGAAAVPRRRPAAF